jgi:hypothetical protein
VCTPPAPVSGRGKATKPQEEALMGPFPFTSNTKWMELISNVAKVLRCHPDQTATSTMFWKFLKPKNSPYLPVKDEEGFAGLHKQLLKKNSDKEFIIKITRAEHAPVNATMVCSQYDIISTNSFTLRQLGQLFPHQIALDLLEV